MNAATLKRCESLLTTCRMIIASGDVVQFVVGITTDPSTRRQHYRRWAKGLGGNLDGFVLLDWKRTATEGEAIERYLFEGLVDHPGCGVIDMTYKNSVKRTSDDQTIYIAWWSPYLVVADPA